MRTTYMDTVKSARENRKWYVIDATDLVLGRMSVVFMFMLDLNMNKMLKNLKYFL